MTITIIYNDNTINNIENIDELFNDNNYNNIISLYCENNNLSEIPNKICELINLKELSISNNNLYELPSNISKLINLETLNCSNTYLNKIDENVCKLKNLKYLNYSNTNLTELPSSINNLINLEALYLNNNHVKEIQLNLKNIKSLNCSNNLLNNINIITNFQNLEKIDCSNNEIIELPNNLGDLTNLLYLDCSNNKINSIPKSIAKLQLLQYLNLQNNELNDVPNEIMFCKSLIRINLNNCELNQNIKDFINKINIIHNHTQYYIDGYNLTVHDENIQESVKKIVQKLLENKHTINYDKLKEEIINNKDIEFKELLLNYMELHEYHPTLNCMFIDVFEKVYDEINENKLFNKLIKQLHHSDCKCITGLITRLVYTLNSIDNLDEDNDIIDIIIKHKKKYHNVNKFVKNEICKELKEIGYSEEIINIWYESL